jgi:hypothetical protein
LLGKRCGLLIFRLVVDFQANEAPNGGHITTTPTT